MSKRVIFVVDVAVVENNEFKTVAEGLKLHEPVWYKESVMKEAVRKEYPKLHEEKLKGKAWTVTIINWLPSHK